MLFIYLFLANMPAKFQKKKKEEGLYVVHALWLIFDLPYLNQKR